MAKIPGTDIKIPGIDIDLPDLPTLPDLPEFDIPNPLEGIQQGFSELGQAIETVIMRTITIVAMVGISIFIVGVAGWLGYTYFLAPQIAKRKAQTLRMATEVRSEEHTSELQSHSFISYAVFCLKKKTPHPGYMILTLN